jgi:hypothetical protein
MSQTYYREDISLVALTYGHLITLLDLGRTSHHVVRDIAHHLCATIEVAEHMVTRVEVDEEVTGKLGWQWLPTTDPCLEMAQEPLVVCFKPQN